MLLINGANEPKKGLHEQLETINLSKESVKCHIVHCYFAGVSVCGELRYKVAKFEQVKCVNPR